MSMLMPDAKGKYTQVTNEHFLTYLNTIISCMVIEGYQLRLKGTPLYRHNIKFHSKQLRALMSAEMSSTVDALADADMESLETISDNMDQLIPLFSKLKPEDIPYIRAIMQAFLLDRDRMVPLVTAHLGTYLKMQSNENVS